MPKFSKKAYVRPEVLVKYMEENDVTKTGLSRMLGFNTNFVNDILRRRTCGYPTAQKVCEMLGIKEYEFIDHIRDFSTGDVTKIENVVVKEIDNIENSLCDLPFTNEDWLVPRKQDVQISKWIIGDRNTIKIIFTEDALKRLNSEYVRIAIKNGRVYFVRSYESDDSKYVMSKNGITVTDSRCVKRIEEYIGKYDMKYNDMFDIFYLEGDE